MKIKTETSFESAFGTYQMERYPKTGDKSLRAWNAADLYILEYLKKCDIKDFGELWIVNDTFGSLGVALSGGKSFAYSDSYISHEALRRNLSKNSLSTSSIKFVKSTKKLDAKKIDTLVIKIPKNQSLLEDQLQQLGPKLERSTLIVAASMVKHMHKSTIDLFEKYLGPTSTSLAKKKARLLFCDAEPSICESQHRSWPKEVLSFEGGPVMVNHANVFSREKFDIGTRFLIENLGVETKKERVLDLGCGNGVLGTSYAMQNPDADLIFVDESYMAIQSARETFEKNLPERTATFLEGDGLSELEIDAGSIDKVLCNPPFHNQFEIGSDTAERMFRDSKKILRKGGQLRVVGNNHLAYHVKLRKLFGNVETVAKNKKFKVFASTRS